MEGKLFAAVRLGLVKECGIEKEMLRRNLTGGECGGP